METKQKKKKKGEKKPVQAAERFIVVFINIEMHAHLLQKYSLLPGSELIQEKRIFYSSHLVLHTNVILTNMLVGLIEDQPKTEKFADQL